MFENLLSLLPYNPSLAHQMAFYSRRMRAEASLRRTGTVFLVLAFMVQFFAVLSPPQPTIAGSINDLVSGGIGSAADAAGACRDNVRGYGDILDNYGITCTQVANSPTIQIRATDHNRQLFSLGHLPYGKPGETPVNIKGNKLYWRYLWGWPYGSQQIKVLRILSQGKTFYIMYECGNLVSIGFPPPVVKPKPTPVQKPTPVTKPTPAAASTPVPTPTPVPAPTPTPAPTLTPIPPLATCVFNSELAPGDSGCKPCEQSLSSEDTLACVTVHKTASNITTAAADADGTTASAGDVINYTIFAQNNGKATVKQFVFQDSMSDVLDYADITDAHGGSFDNTEKVVSWPAEDIAVGQTASVQITVRVKDPIPGTPADPNDPNHFDLVMTNVYGNTININLPASPAKTVETTAATLPNTGPGAGLFIAGSVVMVASYFYGRARLLARESILAVQETTGA